MNRMTQKEILKGLNHRLKELKKVLQVIEEEKGKEVLPMVLSNWEGRIDEIESIIYWIKGEK